MSQEQDFAKLVLNHPAKEKVLDRISGRLLKKFRHGDDAIRIEVSKLIDSLEMFMGELQIIQDESIDLNQEREDATEQK